jgi:hypothetical protein
VVGIEGSLSTIVNCPAIAIYPYTVISKSIIRNPVIPNEVRDPCLTNTPSAFQGISTASQAAPAT